MADEDSQQTGNEQVERNKPITLMHTELLGSIRKVLRAVEQEIDKPISALQKIRKRLEALPGGWVNWSSVDQQFRIIHPKFKSRLIDAYPDLTRQEIKVCQLLRLGIKTMEIATILHISGRSLEIHQLNIRKKCGLKTQDRLPQFLENIL